MFRLSMVYLFSVIAGDPQVFFLYPDATDLRYLCRHAPADPKMLFFAELSH